MIVRPNIAKPVHAVRATKPSKSCLVLETSGTAGHNLQIEFIVPCYNGVVCSGRRDLPWWRAAICAVRNENFPSIVRHLQGIQVERDQVIEEESLDLTAKNEYLRSYYIQCVTVAA